MRKKLMVSLCITAILVAVLAVTALAIDVTGPSTVTSGSEIEITVTGTMKGLSATISTTGLEFVSVDGGLSDEEMLILLEDFGGMKGVYKYKVTAADGQPVSFNMTAVRESDGEKDILAPDYTWSGTVGGTFETTSSEPPATQAPAAPVQSTDAQGAAASAADAAQDAAAQASSEAASAQPTEGPHTADGSVNVWLLCIGAAACAIIAVLIGRRVFRRAR